MHRKCNVIFVIQDLHVNQNRLQLKYFVTIIGYTYAKATSTSILEQKVNLIYYLQVTLLKSLSMAKPAKSSKHRKI